MKLIGYKMHQKTHKKTGSKKFEFYRDSYG